MTSEAPGSGARGPYAKGVQRRREILDRALEVFAEKGAESTSLRAIGEAIGVSHAALKHYFDSREELLIEVLRERDAAANATMTGKLGPLGRMTEAADINVKIPGIVALHTVMMAAAVEPGNDVAREFFTERFATGRRDLAAQIADALSEREIETDVDLDNLAALIMAASDGLQVQWLLDPTVDLAGSLRLLQRIVAPPPSSTQDD